MKPPNHRRSTRAWATVWLTAATALAACQSLVTAVPLSEQLAPLDMALSEDPDAVEARANSGDGQAQLAMSIVSMYGLHGRTPDIVAAGRWRDQALANRRVMPITQYTAAFNGSPSRVNIINVPVQTISAAQWQTVNRCVAVLAGEGVSDQSACGDAEENRRRQTAWRRSIEE
jgi:hypothetical protein